MSRVRFLFDVHLSRALVRLLLREDPTIDILRVGAAGAPPARTTDPDLLMAAEAAGRALVTRDRRTLPQHVADHVAAGRHTWGVFILTKKLPLRRYVEELFLIWFASEAEEWQDQMVYLPWP